VSQTIRNSKHLAPDVESYATAVVRKPLGLFAILHCCKFLLQYMTTCLGIRNATHWADARSIERISCSINNVL